MAISFRPPEALPIRSDVGDMMCSWRPSPAVVIQACFLVNSTADAARSAVKANQQCGPLAAAAYRAVQTTKADYIKQTDHALQDLSNSNLYRSQSF